MLVMILLVVGTKLYQTNKNIEEIYLNQSATVIHISHKSSDSLRIKYDKVLKMENGRLQEITF